MNCIKKSFFLKRYDTYRFSKDLDFNIIKNVSIDTLENFIDELTDNIYDNHWLDFQRIWNTREWDYWFRSYAIKIKLRNPWFDIWERVTIKFDFAIRPWFDKPYEEYFIPNHYQEYLDLEWDIYCLSETIESILYWKFLELFWEEKRTEPKDFYDIVQILNKQLIQDKWIIQDIVNSFDIYLPKARLNTIERNWNDSFEDNDFQNRSSCCDWYEKDFYDENNLEDNIYYINENSEYHIYKITEKKTWKSYIWQTRNAPIFRWWDHYTKSSAPFWKYIQSTKINEWTFEVIESFSHTYKYSDILLKESEYIKKYNSIENWFNTVISNKEVKNN